MSKRGFKRSGAALLCALTVPVAGVFTAAASGSRPGAANASIKASQNVADEQLTGGVNGGTLRVLSTESFSSLDPGQAYFSLDYSAVYAMERPLFIYMPNSASHLVPDLATAIPTVADGGISDGGRTVTVHIEPNVDYAPPVNRAVTTADVKYAIERLANPAVSNGYFPAYFANTLVGATNAHGSVIPGIETPDPTTIVFHLTRPDADTFVQALSLPGTAPVPPEVVASADGSTRTSFGTKVMTATGPYMIAGEQNANRATGYVPDKSLTLVRNPNWNPATYAGTYQPPAHLDQIDIREGGTGDAIARSVLNGTDMAQLDTPTSAAVTAAANGTAARISFAAGAGNHYVSLNNAHGIFTNVNIRRAVYANFDRAAVAEASGAPRTAQLATHFITPGTEGFSQAGGNAGPQYPWNQHPSGDLTLARRYLRAAGYPTGRYTGRLTATIVGTDDGAASHAINEVLKRDFTELGIRTRLLEVGEQAMYSDCQNPRADVDACPSVGWIRDFDNAYSVLYPTFSGAVLSPSWNEENFGRVDDPTLNRLMTQAEQAVSPAVSSRLWAAADRRIVEQAEALPEVDNIQANIYSGDVRWVGDLWNTGSVDFAYTSLK